MAFYSYLTALRVHIGMEAMHCAGSTAHWTTKLKLFHLKHAHKCSHASHTYIKQQMQEHVQATVNRKPATLLSQEYVRTCTPQVNIYAFIYAYACIKCAYVCHTHHKHSEWKSSPTPHHHNPIRPLLQRASLKLLTVSVGRWFFEVKRTHLPQNPNMIDTDRNQDELRWNWTKMNWTDSEMRGRACFRGASQTHCQNFHSVMVFFHT